MKRGLQGIMELPHTNVLRVMGRLLVTAGSLMVTIPRGLVAQGVAQARLEDFLTQRTLMEEGGVGSPTRTGARLAYTVCDPKRIAAARDLGSDPWYATSGVPRLAVGCDVWVRSTDGTPPTNITGGRGNNWAPTWSPSGETLAFFSDRDGAPRLWEWSTRTGQVRRITGGIVRAVLPTDRPQWTADGASVIVPLLPLNDGTVHGVRGRRVPRESPRAASRVTVRVLRAPPRDTTQPPVQPQTLPEWMKVDVAVVQVETGVTRRLLHHVSIKGYKPAPVGPLVAVMVTHPLPKRTTAGQLADIVLLSVASDTVRVVAHDLLDRGAWGPPMSWSPDGRWLAYLTETTDGGTDCRVVATATGADHLLSSAPHPRFRYNGTGPLWDPESRAVYLPSAHGIWRMTLRETGIDRVATVSAEIVDVISTFNGQRYWSSDGSTLDAVTLDSTTRQSTILRVDIRSGVVTRVNTAAVHYGTGTDHPIGSADGHTAFFVREDATHAPDVWTLQWGAATLHQLTRLNPQLAVDRLGISRLVQWRDAVGKVQRGALLLPAGYDPTRQYPLVVWIYPTSRGSEFVNRFGFWQIPFNMQVLAAEGYAVLYPDCATHIGTPMQDILDAVMPGVDRVIALGIADSARLAVMGHSYGGYGVLSLIVQTPRFKAAVMSAGLADPISFYGSLRADGISGGVQHMETGQGKMGGPPWSVPERYLANTPIFYLDRVRTPLLMQAGTADGFPAVQQAEEAFVGLRRLGRDVTLLEYTGEEHLIQSHDNLLDYWQRVLRFLADHLDDPDSAAGRG